MDFYVQANSLRLRQVLVNLLTNDIKYNHSGGSITITTEKISPDDIKILVTDSGIGMAPEEISQLFIPFNRLPYAEKNAIEGTGIGLSLCKHLVEEMKE